ncbi:uncharacterized protein TNCV_3089071 [Trichonephila clavipes]|nr:uncharacterized protein TNCV_3089071 [Trichonephila clavipes]
MSQTRGVAKRMRVYTYTFRTPQWLKILRYPTERPSQSCCRVSAADKGCRVYPSDPRPDAVALCSGCTPGKCRAWFLPDDRYTASLVGLRGGWRHAMKKFFLAPMDPNMLCLALSTEVQPSISLSESVAPTSNNEHFNTSQIPKRLKQNSKNRKRRVKEQKAEIEIKLTSYTPKKSYVHHTSEDEDMIVYDVEEDESFKEFIKNGYSHFITTTTNTIESDNGQIELNRWIPRGVSFQRPRHRLIAVASLGRLPRNRSIRVSFTRYPRTALSDRWRSLGITSLRNIGGIRYVHIHSYSTDKVDVIYLGLSTLNVVHELLDNGTCQVGSHTDRLSRTLLITG